MKTIIYRCELLLIFVIPFSISSASVTEPLNCVHASTDASQRLLFDDIEFEALPDTSIPFGIHLMITK